MKLYVFSQTDFGVWSVIDETGVYACEFDYDEIGLLNHFIPVMGYLSDGIELAVLFGKWSEVGLTYMTTIATDKMVATHQDCIKYINKGYLIFDNEITMSSVMPKIIYGVSAVVTDQGSLIWSNMDKDIRIRLSDICKRVLANSLTCDYPTYVLDNKLSSISVGMCKSRIAHAYRFDISELTDSRLKRLFAAACRNSHVHAI